MVSLPGADPVAIRRRLLHNPKLGEDRSWTWQHHLGSLDEDEVLAVERTVPPLWRLLAGIRAPLMLICGGHSRAVAEADVETLRRLRPGARVEVVDEAGHSVQSDRPERLSELLEQASRVASVGESPLSPWVVLEPAAASRRGSAPDHRFPANSRSRA